MEVLNVKDVEAKEMGSFPYKGTQHDVKGVSIKWLSLAGPDPSAPSYGLRFFTVAPGGSIPIHNHFYVQTMYILTGEFIVYSYDKDTDDKLEEKRVGAHDFVFVPSMEIHSMVNISDTQEATFLCCIANVRDD
jgi:quercetin dioxygenase-like cupin family protein